MKLLSKRNPSSLIGLGLFAMAMLTVSPNLSCLSAQSSSTTLSETFQDSNATLELANKVQPLNRKIKRDEEVVKVTGCKPDFIDSQEAGDNTSQVFNRMVTDEIEVKVPKEFVKVDTGIRSVPMPKSPTEGLPNTAVKMPEVGPKNVPNKDSKFYYDPPNTYALKTPTYMGSIMREDPPSRKDRATYQPGGAAHIFKDSNGNLQILNKNGELTLLADASQAKSAQMQAFIADLDRFVKEHKSGEEIPNYISKYKLKNDGTLEVKNPSGQVEIIAKLSDSKLEDESHLNALMKKNAKDLMENSLKPDDLLNEKIKAHHMNEIGIEATEPAPTTDETKRDREHQYTKKQR